MNATDIAKENQLRQEIGYISEKIAAANDNLTYLTGQLKEKEAELNALTLTPDKVGTDSTIDNTKRRTDASQGTSAR